MTAKIEKRGSDVWLCLPNACVNDLKLCAGSRVEVLKIEAGWCLRPVRRLSGEKLETLVAGITPENRLDLEEDRPVGKEIW